MKRYILRGILDNRIHYRVNHTDIYNLKDKVDFKYKEIDNEVIVKGIDYMGYKYIKYFHCLNSQDTINKKIDEFLTFIDKTISEREKKGITA